MSWTKVAPVPQVFGVFLLIKSMKANCDYIQNKMRKKDQKLTFYNIFERQSNLNTYRYKDADFTTGKNLKNSLSWL